MKNIFEYDLLNTLTAVVKEGSFEGAANHLNITQSAVSQRIKQLEEKAGAVLILRGRPCLPTVAGSNLCQHIERVHLLEHDFLLSIQDDESDQNHQPVSVRIAVNADSLATWFCPVVAKAINEANILLDIVVDDQEYTAERLRNGEALAAVTVDEKPLNGFSKVPLGTLEYVAVTSPGFFEKHFASGVSAPAITSAPCLFFDRKDSLPRNWVSNVFGVQISLTAQWVPSFTGILNCCFNGTGWGLMPRNTVMPYLLNGSLVELSPETKIEVPLFWQYSPNTGQTMGTLSKIVISEARDWLAPSAK